MDTLYFQPMPPNLGVPIEVSGDLELPQFLFLRSNVSDCSQNYTTGQQPTESLAYSFIWKNLIE